MDHSDSVYEVLRVKLTFSELFFTVQRGMLECYKCNDDAICLFHRIFSSFASSCSHIYKTSNKMSLSALNYPPLVATAGLSLGAGMPYIENFLLNSSWNIVRTLTLCSYGLNVWAVSRPGRMDGQAAGDGELSPRNGRTLVAPAGW